MYKKLYVLMVALLTGSAAFSQIHKMERKDSSAVHRTYNLNPVVVTGSGHHQRLKSTTTPVHVISSQEIREQGITSGKVYLHALMSIAGDHAHNDMAGEGEEYWKSNDPENEENSWYEFFSHKDYEVNVPVKNNHPQGLMELEGVRNVWINHTKNAEFLEDAYHSMYPEE